MTAVDQSCPILRRDAVSQSPGAHCGEWLSGQGADGLDAGGSDDFGVGSHSPSMHFALRDCKRLLRNGLDYAECMSEPAERLRIARLRAGYETAKDAAESLGFPVSTYLGHENGSRGISAKKAEIYARKYKVREQWLLYGVGPGPGSERNGETAEIIDIVEHLPPIRRSEALRILRVLAGDQGA